MCGLSFADEREALSFYTKVINRENLRLAQRNPSVPKKSTASAAPGNSISQAAPDVSGILPSNSLFYCTFIFH